MFSFDLYYNEMVNQIFHFFNACIYILHMTLEKKI